MGDTLPLFLSSRKFRAIFALTFIIYFVFFQWADRILLFNNIKFPSGVSLVVDTSPSVPPSQMPFPLWGPFISITTPNFDWAMTPLSLGISFMLSFLVALNVTLYTIYFSIIRAGAKASLAASLGVLATSLSCSCELFTGIIGSVVSNIPFLGSLAFMTRLDEGLVSLAGVLLTVSTLVLYEEIEGGRPLDFLSRNRKSLEAFVGGGLILALVLIPQDFTFSLVRLAAAISLGGIAGAFVGKKWRAGLPVSVVLLFVLFILFPLLYQGPLLDVIGTALGVFGYLGYSSMKRWAQLGLLHVLAWSLIMPGPISLILGTPIGFFNFPSGELLEFWISSWVIGTPIAWGAGIGLLQYIRDNMVNRERGLRITLPTPSMQRGGVTWIVLGLVAVLSQFAFFLTHSDFFLYYNGYDGTFLTVMTVTSTSIAVAGAIALGYGILMEIRSRYPLRWKVKELWPAIPLALVFSLLSGVIHIAPSGFPYSTFTLGTFGAPMMAPWINIYVPQVVGVFLYPLQVLQIIAASLMSGALVSTSIKYGGKRAIPSMMLGSFAICPACVLSSFSLTTIWGSVVGSLMATAAGQIGVSIASDGVLLAALLYVLRKTSCSLDGISKKRA